MKKLRRPLVITTLLIGSLGAVAACSRAQAQSVKSVQTIRRLDGSVIAPTEIDATVTRLISEAKVAGIGIAILNDGKVAYLKTYGVRDKEKNLPLTPDTVMLSASFSKVAFACLVMQLTDDRVIDLDKPVYRYLPRPLTEYDAYRDLTDDPRYKKITAGMLLSHTSGFPNWRGKEKLSIHFEPGSQFAYSGEGIALLQLVVETAAGKPLNDLMRDRVFQPLGMTRTSMVWEDRFEDDHANGYDEEERSLGPYKGTGAHAAGSMQTTITDFSRFLLAVRRGERLLPQTREQMLSPQVRILSQHEFPTLSTKTTDENKPISLSYGLGWGLYWTPYGKAFFKEGHDEGWEHYAVCFDKTGTGLVIMTNSSNGESIYKELLETLIGNTYTPIEWEGFTPYHPQK